MHKKIITTNCYHNIHIHEDGENLEHSHMHTHKNIGHLHDHTPDIHHRHGH